MFTVIDVDLSKYLDTIRHSILLDKIAKRVQAPQVMHLIKQIIKAAGKIGVPQGSPLSPLAANIYLNEIDWMLKNRLRKSMPWWRDGATTSEWATPVVLSAKCATTWR
jgi:retron-type reverse transcriptase